MRLRSTPAFRKGADLFEAGVDHHLALARVNHFPHLCTKGDGTAPLQALYMNRIRGASSPSFPRAPRAVQRDRAPVPLSFRGPTATRSQRRRILTDDRVGWPFLLTRTPEATASAAESTAASATACPPSPAAARRHLRVGSNRHVPV